jgi:glucosamine-6-phosphate deaminase
MVEGPVSARCPASVLQLHPHASVLLDEQAARDLTLADDVRETWVGKPSWQGL